MLILDTGMDTTLWQQAYAINASSEAILKIHHLLQAQEELIYKQKIDAEKISNLEIEVARLKEQLKLSNHHLFGKKSEKNLGEEQGKQITVSSHVRKIGRKVNGRNIDTSNLRRFKIYHELSQEQLKCTCCHHTLERIGQDVAEQLEVIPMQLYVAEHIRYKYSCKVCRTIIMASKPMSPIPKAMAGSSLLAEVIANKYQYHLPLYRQSKILSSYNANIPDNTLGNWVMQSGEGLKPIYQAMWQAIISVKYIQADETHMKILHPEKKGYLWGYYTTLLGKGFVVFEIAATRSGSVARDRLSAFKGLLQTDGYAGYTKLKNSADIVGLSCLSHFRRKFDEILKSSKNHQGVAAEFIARVKPVYALESRMRDLKVNFHTRKRMRIKYALPILKQLRKWLKQQKIPPNSKLADAVGYFLERYHYFIAYTHHGMAEIDTNLLENQNRHIACGRKNCMFVGSKDSGEISALWYSIVATALLNGLNPRIYIQFLLTKVHALRKGEISAMALLPHTIDRQLLQNFADEQVTVAKQVLNSS